ncbi:MAG: acyltransferase [Lachnospiraceae bacterium]|nr:acyltransferase [Lachnospiraceae bacterium]
MGKKRQFYGLDVLKFVMAVLVAARHMIQVFYPAESRWRLLIGSWLSNLAVPVFLVIAGFLLFRKIPEFDGTDRAKWRQAGWRTVSKYCVRILKLYLLWCVLYWPIDLYNYVQGMESWQETVRHYIKSFFFSSTIAQLWYLPALLVACLMVWFFWAYGMRLWQMLIVTGLLFVAGCIGDNWYFNQQIPMKLQQVLFWYLEHFVTMRNGVFYGSFYVCLGLLFAQKKWRLPSLISAAGAILSIWLMYREVVRCSNTNMVFFAVPAAYFLMEFALSLQWKDRNCYPRLRGMSEWIYLFHFYIFYIFSWTAKMNPIPLTERNIALMVLIPLIAFSWCMVRLSEWKGFGWLKKMI